MRYRKKLFLLLVSLIITLSVLSIADSTFIARIAPSSGITLKEIHYLPPNTTAVYETDEFRYTVTTNAQGYRGDNVAKERAPNSIRILTLGDSYTYGWGGGSEQHMAGSGTNIFAKNVWQ